MNYRRCFFEEGDIERAYKYIDTSLDDVFRAKGEDEIEGSR